MTSTSKIQPGQETLAEEPSWKSLFPHTSFICHILSGCRLHPELHRCLSGRKGFKCLTQTQSWVPSRLISTLGNASGIPCRESIQSYLHGKRTILLLSMSEADLQETERAELSLFKWGLNLMGKVMLHPELRPHDLGSEVKNILCLLKTVSQGRFLSLRNPPLFTQ